MVGCVLLGIGGVLLAVRLVHHHFHGGGCGGHRCGPGGGWPGHGRWHGGGFGESPWHRTADDDDGAGAGPAGPAASGPGGGGFWIRGLLRRLDATPAQEKVIREALGEFRAATTKLREEGRRTRADVAGAFRKESFDEVMMGELFARHDGALEQLRRAFVGLGAKIHDALDEQQRGRLADLLQSGRGAWGPSGGFPGGGWGGGGWGGHGGGAGRWGWS